jgi:site-specific recombinase XerD
MRLDMAIDDYLLTCRAANRSVHTIRWYKQKLDAFRNFAQAELGLDAVEGLQVRHINRFTEWLQQTPSMNGRGVRSTYTVRGYVETIKNFLSWAEAEDLIDDRVLRRVQLPKVEKRIIKTLSREQFDRLMRAADMEPWRTLQLRDRAVLCVLLSTGIRASELCTLRVGDVHYGEGDESYVVVFGKGRKEREVGPLGLECQRHIRRYLRGLDRSPEAALFTSRRTGGALTPSGLDQLLYRLRDFAGPEHFTGIRLSAHTFRHTFAVNYLKQGGDIKRLQLLLGHTSLTVTQGYLEDFQRRDARRGLSVLDGF